MGVLALVLAVLMTAAGVGLIAAAFEVRPLATSGSTLVSLPQKRPADLASLRVWFHELSLFQQVDEFAESNRMASRRPMGKMLIEAGLRLHTSELILISLAGGLAGGAVAWLAVGPNPLVMVVAIGAGLIPRSVVLQLASRRARRIEGQLPAALLLIADTLRAGRSLSMAIDQVGHSAQPPLGDEFTRAARQVGMGTPVEEAVALMADRTGVRDLELLGAAISVARVAGGDLPRLLNSMAAVARSRRTLAGQVRAMTAQARATSLVLSLLPVVVGTVAFFAAPDYFRPMITTTAGWALLVVAGMLVTTGLLMMRGIIARQMR
jgi:tight adherence protein B